jgi:uncharacterized membrane protein
MNVFLWIVQAVMAVLFAASGLGKVGQPREKLIRQYPWVSDVSSGTVKFIGVTEILGAIGLIVPAATGIAPVLTPLAATGLAVLMGIATVFHIRRKETRGIVVAGALFVILALLAVARFGPYSF